MAEESTSSNFRGIGFFGLLTIVFITLKLTGYIGWSWVWVLALIWIGVLLSVALVSVAFFLHKRGG